MHAGTSSIHPETPEIVLKSIFQRYDADHDGLLNQLEFGNALEDLGISDETEQMALFALADANNSMDVSFNDFLNLIRSNDFELILSSREDYEFVIETFKAFQQYDQNGDGQITWNEFYFYLTKHGYSHQYISQYWYYMDTKQTLTVTFEAFWKGFKIQANAIKQHQLQQQLNQQIRQSQILKPNKNTKIKKFHSKVLNTPSMIDSHSWKSNDTNNNIFCILKSQLKPTKQNKSVHSLSLGRVLDDEEEEEEEAKSATPIRTSTPTLIANLNVDTELKSARASRLPDLMALVSSPLHGIIPSFTARTTGLGISLLSPIADVNTESNMSTKSIFAVDIDFASDIASETFLHSPPHLTPNYSITSSNNCSPYKNSKDLIRFPSITHSEDSCDDFVFVDNENKERESLSISNKKQKRMSKKGKRKKKKKKGKKCNKPKLVCSQSEHICIDRTPLLRPRYSSKCKHKVNQSASYD